MENTYVHRLSIGGTDTGAILGLSRWKSRADVWHRLYDLANEVERAPEEENDSIRGGRRTEGANRDLFEQRHGYVVSLPDTMFCDRLGVPRHANLDGLIEAVDERGDGVFEAKYLGPNTFPATQRDGLAPDYYAQVQHYMDVAGLTWTGYSVLSKEGYEGEEFDPDEHLHTFFVERDPEFILRMQEEQVRFWRDYVEAGVCPEPLPGALVECPRVGRVGEDWTDRMEFVELLRRRARLEDEIRVLTHSKKLLDERVVAAMGDVQVVLVGKGRVTYKYSTSKTFPKESQQALQRDFPEVPLEQYRKVNTSRTLRVSGKLP